VNCRPDCQLAGGIAPRRRLHAAPDVGRRCSRATAHSEMLRYFCSYSCARRWTVIS
jgi:hypothetical protein